MDRFDDPKSYRQKRESFTRSLQHFHETRGTPFRKIPQFCGKEVDLFRLYNIVTQRGGWVKVNRTNQWNDILADFNIPKGCVNGGNALKQIYLRYLDRYEKVHYLGESSDRHDLDEEDIETPRHRRWSTRSIHTVPLTYNHHQHVIIDNLRKFNGLSSDIYKASDYDRLALSLVSPLPNEQDFAINVCTLLSNEGKHTLKLDKCPRIVDYLLAHAGVYNHSNLRILFEDIYGRVRGHSLSTFWSDVLETNDLLDLTDENKFVRKTFKRIRLFKSSGGRTFDNNESSISEDNETTASQVRCTTTRKYDSSEVDKWILSESKENDTMDIRLSDSCDNASNSIQDCLKVGKPVTCNNDSYGNSNNNNNDVNMADEKTKFHTERLRGHGSDDVGNVLERDNMQERIDDVTITDVVSSITKVQEITVSEVERKQNESDISTRSTNVNINECAMSNSSELDCEDRQNEGFSKVKRENDGKLERISRGRGQIKLSEKEGVIEIKSPEEIALAEEKRFNEEERLREEKERIESEEKAKREAEENKRLEEERLRNIEEAKKLGKQLEEAEHYEAMLREEEMKKKKVLFNDEITMRKPKNSSQCVLKIEAEDLELFSLGRENGTHDYIGQRVLQVAHILRNLTFCEESMQVMAKNTTFLRFLLLCVNSKWSSLHQLGLDMLGNISSELTIEDPAVDGIFHAFFWTVHRGIQHSNRFFIISCLEILNKICQKDENEDVVCRNLDQNIYDQVCRLLSLHDIMILLYTLECLYSMSSMGEKACTYICRSKGAIEMLLALITVEAQSYGPKACILMRVIETVSGTTAANPPTIQPPAAASPNPAPLTATMVQAGGQPIVTMATASTMTVQAAALPKLITPTIMRTPSPKTLVGMPMAAVATPVQLTQAVCQPVVQTLPTVQQQHAHQQTVQENEQFARAWLRATFELSAGGKVEQQDVYKRYVESCNKMGRKGIIASLHFPRFVRSVFGGTVGPKSFPIPAAEVKPGGPTNQSCYEGIKVRDVPLKINIKLVPVTEVPRPVMKKRTQACTPKPKAKRKKPESPTSPILKAQLIAPNKPSSSSPSSPSPSFADNKVQVSTQTIPVQNALGQSLSPPSTPPPMDNTTLIKSLLASKVSEICMTAPLGMLSDNPQVTQRQQQQKILQQQLEVKAESPSKTKVVRPNGIIQDPSGSSTENHLATTVTKGKKEPPQPPPTCTNVVGNLLRPKTPKIDGEDSDSMASTSRDCNATGGGNVSSADDNDNSLTSFEGIFNGIPESLDFDATVSSIVKENCAKKSDNKSVIASEKNAKQKLTNEENYTIQIPVKSIAEDVCAKQLDDNNKSMTDDSCVVKQTQSKSLMLADLLDKKEGPAVNGVLGKDLRIGEKGFDLVEKAILKGTHLNHKDVTVKKDSVVSVNGEARTGGDRSTVINNATPSSPQCGSKRSATSEADQETIEDKRLKLDKEVGDEKEKTEDLKPPEVVKEKEELNGEEEVRASSTAANLFAALAAEALEDETEFEVPSDPQPQAVVVPGGQIRPFYLGESPPLIVTASGGGQIIMTPGQLSQQGKVLISAGGQSVPVLIQNQRIVQGGSGQMLVASQPQQYIMSGNTPSQMLITQPQTALVQGQPQTVLVAQATPQPGTKTIIILQPQSQGNANPQQQKMITSQGTPMVVATSVARQVVQPTPPLAAPVPSSLVASSSAREGLTTDVVLSSGMQNNPPMSSLHQNGPQIQIISSGIQNNAPILTHADKSKTTNGANKIAGNAKAADGSVFLCEWRGCMRSFKTANEVYMHVCNTHCPSNAEVETQCLWERCDGMKRKRFSLMTHLFDRHCNADALNMMAARRRQLSTQGRTEIPAPTPPPIHPGYAPNAAFHAIKRHALEFVNPKELLKTNGPKASPSPQTPPPPSAVLLSKIASPPVQVKDDNEGPVTKSIRLTASLILRNLVIYSSAGRRFLKGYEPHLASIALSNVESSRTIAQVLADLNDSSSR